MFTPQPLSQRDPRWRDVPLGFNTAGSTIGTHGCLITCVTMIANGFGFIETPTSFNAKLKALGPGVGFTGDTGNLLVWAGIGSALKGLSIHDVDYCAAGAPLERIDAELNNDRPALIKLDFSPAPGLQEHWVLLHKKRDDDYLIVDPWPTPDQGNAASLLTGAYKFGGSAREIIRTVVWLEGHAKMPPSKLIVRVLDTAGDSGLRLREQPSLEAGVKKRLPVGGELRVLEDVATAIQKIGQPGQWLNVHDIEDDEGYVAAWYVGQRIFEQPPEVSLFARGLGADERQLVAPKKSHKKSKKAKRKKK